MKCNNTSDWIQCLFKYRALILAIYTCLLLLIGYKAIYIKPDTDLDRLIPQSHEFVRNAQQFSKSQKVNGTSKIRIAISTLNGNIFSYDYLNSLRNISDEVSVLNGVNTAEVKSLWSPSMLWFGITPLGFDSGPVIDYSTFSNTENSLNQIKNNILRAGIVGDYVSNDFSSTIIEVPIVLNDPITHEKINFSTLSGELESIREKYSTDSLKIQIIGDVKKVADLIDGFEQVFFFFFIAILITSLLLFNYSRCWKTTLISVCCSLSAVILQLGIIQIAGFSIGVFSILVPFLIFAIAVSHSVQFMNGIANEVVSGASSYEAAKITFKNLYRAGIFALISDGIGFAMLLIIDIGTIQDLAKVASVGVAVVIVSNVIILPLIMSYIGVTQSCKHKTASRLENESIIWDVLSYLTRPKQALVCLIVVFIITVLGFKVGSAAKIGDLDKGAPELSAKSQYNLDNEFITSHFSTSSDLMNVYIGTPLGQCESFEVIDLIDRLGWQLQNTKGVQNIHSPAVTAKFNRYLGNEGNLKMMALPRDARVLSRALSKTGMATTTTEKACDSQKLVIELTDHKYDTLNRVISVVRAFALENDSQSYWFRIGDGNASFEGATNEVIEKTQYKVLTLIYLVVTFMCLVMFRQLKAVICILIPLALTSILCQALMAQINIGIKVATLPVVALGVGIGVDYGIYIYSRLAVLLKMGVPLNDAYRETLKSTGNAVLFTGFTLAVGVATWIFSSIKFQVDMGILLMFMFLWNMVGALLLIPALASVIQEIESRIFKQELKASLP